MCQVMERGALPTANLCQLCLEAETRPTTSCCPSVQAAGLPLPCLPLCSHPVEACWQHLTSIPPASPSWTCQDVPFPEQLRIMSGVSLLIMVHGSAIALWPFLPPGAVAVHISPDVESSDSLQRAWADHYVRLGAEGLGR